jgi:hypothetical protein
MKENTNNTSSPLTAFKRSPSLGLSQWENGNLTTNLAEKKDTNGAFFLVEANAALDELIAKDRDVMAYQIAEVYSSRGETDKAFEWLQVPFDDHDTGTLSLLINPFMRGLRHDARYNSLLAKIGLPPRL